MSSLYIGLPPKELMKSFPFHFVFDRTLQLLQMGEVLGRVIPGIKKGHLFKEHFVLQSPQQPEESQDLFAFIEGETEELFMLKSLKQPDLVLRGQMLYIELLEAMLFLGVPWAPSFEALQELGIQREDFAIHDPTPEFLSSSTKEKTNGAMSAPSIVTSEPDFSDFSTKTDLFMANVSHELRTPLNAIIGHIDLLKEEAYGSLTKGQRASIEVIEENGKNLLGLLNDLLDLSKIESGLLGLQTQHFALTPLCQACLQSLKHYAQEKNVKILFTTDSEVAVFAADEQRLKQILMILLENAIKFTPEGGRVGLEVMGDTEKEVAHFTIWDSGVGISEENLRQLFESFVRLDGTSSSTSSKGGGLGLAIAYRLTELHGGSISVESRLGKGSRFIVSLPWKNVSAPFGSSKDAISVDDLISAKPIDPAKPLILIAEDNEMSAQVVMDYLGFKGYSLLLANDGVQALQLAKENVPNLILMDIQMPEMDGLEAMGKLKEDDKLKEIPIIALTALAMPGDKERCIEAGASMYLSKPVSLKQLAEKIEELLR